MKILVVDDNAGTLNAIKVSLISRGHEVLTAKTGENALRIIKEAQINLEQLDLLLTDLRMSKMDGLQLLASAMELKPDIRGILMSAYGDDNIRHKVESMGNCAYLDKPFRPESLIELLEKTPCVDNAPNSRREL
jgi:CheY-like chemotaxis protein